MNKSQGFTILEIMVVVVLLGIIAAFAIPNYSQSIQKGHERDIRLNLITIHSASQVFRAQNGAFWAPGANQNRTAINTALNINILSSDGTSYNYNDDGAGGFDACGAWGTLCLSMDDGPIDTDGVGADNPDVDATPCTCP